MDLKFNNETFLGYSELKHIVSSLGDNGYIDLIKKTAFSFGLVLNLDDKDNGANFHIKEDTSLTLKLDNESYAIDSQGRFIVQEAFTSLAIPQQDVWYWVKIAFSASTKEKGTISIDSSGNITGTNTEFLSKLRGHPDYPSVIRFTNATLNTGEYDVYSIIDNSNAILLGESFQEESNLEYEIVGTFSPEYAPTESEKTIFEYNSCTISFVNESSDNTEPTKGDDEYFIARVKKTTSTLTIQDKRREFFRLKPDNELFKDVVSNNNIIGVERVMYNHQYSDLSQNIVRMGWSIRSQNWSLNSSLKILTLNAASGGKVKTISDLNPSHLVGWRVYPNSDKDLYYIVTSAESQDGSINLYLDYMNPSAFDLQNSDHVLIAPDYDQIEISFLKDQDPNITDTSKVDRQFLLPINKKFHDFEILVPNSTYNYIVKYRYKNSGIYSDLTLIPSDTTNGYYDESSYDDNGILKEEEDRNRVTYTQSDTYGFIKLTSNSNSIEEFRNKVYLGDKLGVADLTLDKDTPILDLEVGVDYQHQIIDKGSYNTLIQNHFINIKPGLKEGNIFILNFNTLPSLSAYTFKIVENYESSSSFDLLYDMTQIRVNSVNAKNIVLKLIYDSDTSSWRVIDLSENLEKTSWVTIEDGSGTVNFETSFSKVSNPGFPTIDVEELKYRKVDDCIEIIGQCKKTVSNTSDVTVFSLPEGFRPSFNRYITLWNVQASTIIVGIIEAGGDVKVSDITSINGSATATIDFNMRIPITS